MHSEGLDSTITKFIELYGDRTGQKGAGVHGGLAWVGEEKFVLLASGGEGAADAADWRRMSRLAALAQHLRRPVLLWDMPLQVVATVLQKQPLVINEAIQDCKLALLRMRVPVISVFKDRFPVVVQTGDCHGRRRGDSVGSCRVVRLNKRESAANHDGPQWETRPETGDFGAL